MVAPNPERYCKCCRRWRLVTLFIDPETGFAGEFCLECRNPARPPPPHTKRKRGEPLTHFTAARLRKVVTELAEREQEALRLFEPLPHQEEALKSQASERLIRGSNQSGKTLTASIDVAMFATGQHPHRKTPKGGVEIYLVAKDEKQIGDVWWKKLCLPGAFEIIRDEVTGKWRSYRPATDNARKNERQPAPPLIPERFWDGKPAWARQNVGIPRLLKLKNGTRIHFFTGNAKPMHGTQIHACYFDEEIGSQTWYSEIAARLLRFNGHFVWSATPQAATEGLYELHLRAGDEAPKPRPAVTEHFLHIKENPHIDDEAKAVLKAKLTDPEQYRVRWEGQYAGTILHIFPNWNPHTHVGTLTKDGWVTGPDCDKPNMPIPKDWTRYAVVDPGSACCAVLFAAVPPPDLDSETKRNKNDYIYLYDELYLQPCMSADIFAERFKGKVQDDHFYEFIIDCHARAKEESAGLSTQLQYERALAERKIRCETNGSGMIWGMDDKEGGNIAIHDWLHVRAETGDPKLRVLRGMCPNFEWEIARYRRKRDPSGKITDKPVDKDDHLVDCLRYLRGRDPQWHKPTSNDPAKKTSYERFKEFMGKLHRQDEESYINLGPGRGTQRISA